LLFLTVILLLSLVTIQLTQLFTAAAHSIIVVAADGTANLIDGFTRTVHATTSTDAAQALYQDLAEIHDHARWHFRCWAYMARLTSLFYGYHMHIILSLVATTLAGIVGCLIKTFLFRRSPSQPRSNWRANRSEARLNRPSTFVRGEIPINPNHEYYLLPPVLSKSLRFNFAKLARFVCDCKGIVAPAVIRTICAPGLPTQLYYFPRCAINCVAAIYNRML
jgi:hypothetical protein